MLPGRVILQTHSTQFHDSPLGAVGRELPYGTMFASIVLCYPLQSHASLILPRFSFFRMAPLGSRPYRILISPTRPSDTITLHQQKRPDSLTRGEVLQFILERTRNNESCLVGVDMTHMNMFTITDQFAVLTSSKRAAPNLQTRHPTHSWDMGVNSAISPG